MTLLLEKQLPKGVSEREACDVLDICRNSLRAARARDAFCGPPRPALTDASARQRISRAP